MCCHISSLSRLNNNNNNNDDDDDGDDNNNNNKWARKWPIERK